VAVTPPSTWKTPTALPPLIVTPALGPSMTSGPADSLSSSVLERVIVFCVAKTVGSKLMALPAGLVLALA